MNEEDTRWAVAWAQVLHKIKEGSETEGSDTRLTSQECKDMVKGLRILNTSVKEQSLDPNTHDLDPRQER